MRDEGRKLPKARYIELDWWNGPYLVPNLKRTKLLDIRKDFEGLSVINSHEMVRSPLNHFLKRDGTAIL